MIVKWTTRFHCYSDKRYGLSHFRDLDFVVREGSEYGKVQKVSPKGIDWQREGAKMIKPRSQKWLKTLRLSLKEVDSGCEFDNRNSLFTDKRNVLSHFGDLDSVTLEGSENGEVHKVSPKGINKGRLQKGQNEHPQNGPKRYVYQ